MFRPFASVRARTTLGATVVVALALVAAGVTVISVLRGDLMDRVSLQSEVRARAVAGSQAALNGRFTEVSLPDDEDHLVQIVDSAGKVLAASEPLHGRAPLTTYDPAPVPAHTAKSPERDDNDGDDGDDSDSGDGSDDNEKTPPRGQVSTSADHKTVAVSINADTDADSGDPDEKHDYRFASVHATTYDGRTYTVYAATPLEDEQETVTSVTRAMLIGLPLLLLVIAAVTWLVTRRALRPVEAIRARMAEITTSHDLSRRVPEPASRDEVARLAATTNQTLAALETSVERQRRFVADASHELRNPIASLRAQLEVAHAHPELLETEGLLEEVTRLQTLAADLLLLARLDAGERVEGTQSTDSTEGAGRGAVDLARLVRAELVQRAATDRITPDVQITGESHGVSGNASQLTRVLGNLLDNAQRHATTRVSVALSREDDLVVLTVGDDGAGVPPAERERIFERFVRLDDARSRDEGGAGLGLAIVRDVVQRHGGRISVRRAPEGGALFEVRLPLADADADADGDGDAGSGTAP
ncbi:sensor histidine kinase [Streptomyces telluris]|uniref:histidine kinase n=1 Tax=Streptomyces telluris TaxID=2720021 RepID=A0A9X2RPP3_9ACTN|nr:HAMP domain-containing sensor histidine kinase [Streptomyces telluris]MCQ8771315.1 HAMP domain-containing histidine kinase [Streptomyces telluris]NJP78331.1 HAMP domain-containing histidine kinase [Streptomyces telluris]